MKNSIAAVHRISLAISASLAALLLASFGSAEQVTSYRVTQNANAFRNLDRCVDLFNAMSDDEAYRRAKRAHAAGQFTFWPAGTRVTILPGPRTDVFVMARDTKGRSGCISSAWLARIK